MIFILIGLGLIGFLPLVIILVRKKKNDRLKKHGVTTTATVRNVYGFSMRGINLVQVEYRVIETGQLLSKNLRVAGMPYTIGDELSVIYDPRNPQHMELDFKRGFLPMLIFTILIAAAILFACFKLKQMIDSGEA